SYGAKNVMPLYRQSAIPNITAGLLSAVGSALGVHVSERDLLAYVHSLLGTRAFADAFANELAEAAGPVHVPLTANRELFERAVALGQDLIWWHTWGERFMPEGETALPLGSATEKTAVHGYPERFDYNAESLELVIGTGVVAS